ncbi:MAG: class I SAM-dependent methyltransferase [Planctomycetes bacterium]|nr:class I SAM-dependent methyltransferase [Planctomycetota bacterium]
MRRTAHHAGVAPPAAVSAWLQRFAGLARPGARAVDVACGAGRHARWLAARGCRVLALDRDRAALASCAAPGVARLCCDLEADGWPLADAARFDLVLVTRYLWRPLLPALVAAVAAGGALLYETFGVGQEQLGRPRRPEFLLRPGELLDAVRGELEVVAYEWGRADLPEPAIVQRIAAVRAPAAPPALGSGPA